MSVKLHGNLVEHIKIKRLAVYCDIPRAQAVGHVVALWCWALRHAPDGNLSELSAEEIGSEAMWYGEHMTDAEFCDVLVSFRLIDKTDRGYKIHGWPEMPGSL